MFEAYKVSVVMVLDNKISPVLSMIAKDLEKLDGLTTIFRESLAKISVDATGLKGLSASLSSTNRLFERAAFSAAALNRELAAMRATGGSIPRLPGGGGGGGGSGGGSGGRGSGGFHGGNIHVGPGGIGLGAVGMATGDWFWPLAAISGAAYAGNSLFQSAKDLNTEQARFRLLGMSEAQNQQAFAYARGLNIYGTNQVDRLAAMREAQGVGRESGLAGMDALKFAMMATPALAKLDALGAGLDGESMAALHSSNLAYLRFAEQAGGLQGPAEFNRLLNMAYKVKQSSGGTLDARQFLNATKMGGAYTQNMSELGWATDEPLLQEMGGARYGTARKTAGRYLDGLMSQTPKNFIEVAERLGLWTPTRHSLSPEDSALYKSGFDQFYFKRLAPLYDKLGITGAERDRDDAILFRRGGADLAVIANKAKPAIMNSFGAYNAALSLDQAYWRLPETLSAQEQEFEKAWSDFKTDWGTSILPFFTRILKIGDQLLRPGDENSPWYIKAAKSIPTLNPYSMTSSAVDAFGSLLGNTFGNPTGGSRPEFAGPGHRMGPSNNGGMLHATINVDGKKIASAFVPYLTNPMTGAQIGPSGGDPLAYMPITGGSPF